MCCCSNGAARSWAAKAPLTPGDTPIDQRIYNKALKHLRGCCLAMPEVREVETWGHPTFQAGKKAFAVLEEYQGVLGVALRVGNERREELLPEDERFFDTPYCGHRGWVTYVLDRATDWERLTGLALESYRTVAIARMLRALNEPGDGTGDPRPRR